MSKTLSLVCWNVQFATFGADNSYVIEKLESLAKPDIICLQEYVEGGDSRLQSWLKKNDYQMSYLPFATISGYSQGVMTAVRKAYTAHSNPVVLREDKPITLRPFPNIRGMLSTKVTIGPKDIFINNFHATYPRPFTTDMRRGEFNKLREFIDEELEDTNWLLCGDFNFLPRDRRKTHLTNRYEYFTGGPAEKTWRHAAKYSPLQANLDYIFWNKKVLLVNGRLGDFTVSDHRPLIATLVP